MDSPEPCYRPARAARVALLVALVSLCLPAAAAAAPGDIVTVAGNGSDGSNGDGGQATSAQLKAPSGLALSAGGELFIADYFAHRVRKVTAGGVISTLAGNGSAGFAGDGGQATSATLNFPRDLIVDSTGNVYIADSLNRRIRRVSTSGQISTFAGTGTAGLTGDGGPASAAQLSEPAGLDIDAAGNIYFTDVGNHTVRRVAPDGTITRVAGTGTAGSTGDGGQATSATLNQPGDVAIDGAGNVYITEYNGHRVRKVTQAGVITTVAGTGSYGYSGDGGPATSAQMRRPLGTVVDSRGQLFVSEFESHVARTVNTAGTISRVAGTGSPGYAGDGGAATSAELFSPARLALSPTGDVYISDFTNHRVRRVSALAAPAAPTFTSVTPSSPANANSVAVRGTSSAGGTVRLYTNSTCTSAVAATGSAATFSTTGLTVTVLDNTTTTYWATTEVAGAVSGCSASSITFVEDSAGPPAPTFNSEPGSPSSATNPSWSFSSAETGVTFECRMERGATLLSDWAGCSSPHAYDLSGEVDGTYTLSVRGVDASGNRGSAATSNYVFDRSVPASPTIDAGPGVTGSDREPEWSFSSGETGVTFECRLDRGATPISAWGACTDPRSYDLTGEPDGTYRFSVRAKNAALTTSPPTTDSYILDTAAPAAPSIDSTPASPSSSRDPGWSFSGEAGATFECRLERGGSLVFDWGACSSPRTFDLTGQPDGAYTFSVRARDAAGNRGSATTSGYTLDTTAPAAPSIDAAPVSPGSGRGPQWSFSGESGATLECRLDRGGTLVSDWGACTSPHAYDLSGQPDAAYTFSVRARDAAGNVGSAATSGYTLDTTPGALSIDSAPGPVGRDVHPAWSFSGEAGSSFACRLARGGDTLVDWSPCTSAWTADLSGQPDGVYSFAVRSTDAAGNVSAPISREYTLDTAPPAAPVLTSEPPARARDRAPSWTFTGEPGSRFECRVDREGAVVADWRSCDGSFSADLGGLDDAAYSFAVRALDAAGNTSSAATSEYRLDTTGPERPRIESSPGRQGEDRTPRWGFRAESGTTLECRLTKGAGIIADWSPCTSPQGYDLRSRADGEYRFAVKAIDVAGNRSQSATDDYELRTEEPATREPDRRDDGDAPAGDGPAAADPSQPAAEPAGDSEPARSPPASDPSSDDGARDPSKGGDAAGRRASGGGAGGPGAAVDATPGNGGGSSGSDGAETGEASGGSRRNGVSHVAQEVTRQIGRAARAIVENPDKSVFPASLLFIVFGFLVVQGRMDRNDPKLALAPVFADPDLDFSPPPTNR